MAGYVVRPGVHVPACVDLDAHIAAAVAETTGSPMPLTTFVDEVRADWAHEQEIADLGDEAVIAYWRSAEADFAKRFLS